MNIFGPFILTLISGFSTLLGSLFIFIKFKRVEETIVFFLSTSASIMLFISIFELIPDSINIMINKYSCLYGILISLLIFLLGYQTVYFIENKLKKDTTSLYRVGILSMISMMLHNLPEGIIVFMSSYNNFKLGFKLCIAIILHNIPEGICISIPIYYDTGSRGRATLLTLLSSLAEPLGALLSYTILKNHINNTTISYIMLFVSGLMICISINNILKEILSYKLYKIMILGIITSSLLFLIVS